MHSIRLTITTLGIEGQKIFELLKLLTLFVVYFFLNLKLAALSLRLFYGLTILKTNVKSYS